MLTRSPSNYHHHQRTTYTTRHHHYQHYWYTTASSSSSSTAAIATEKKLLSGDDRHRDQYSCCTPTQRFSRISISIIGLLCLCFLLSTSSSSSFGLDRTTSSIRRSLLSSSLASSLFEQQQKQTEIETEIDHHNHRFDNYRFLTFGTSRTWGTRLKNRKEQAYPWLLSKMNTTRNLAIRAAGPQYPALCTQSMVGDGENEIYDVIILEYNLRADKDLIQLARRLRQRFPKATIIFLHIWLPFQLHHKPSNRNIKAIVENSLDKSKKPAAAYNYSVLLDIVNQTKHYEWEFRDSVSSHLAIQQAAYEVKGYIYDLHRPKSTLQAMLEYGPFFQWDMIHYSEAGHAMIAEEIRKLLTRVDAQPSNETRPWKDKDRCMSWFETGEIPRGVEGDGVVMNQFTKHKYGLELQGRSARLGIRNTLNRTLNVYLSYMATGPHKDYPTAEVTIVTNDGENNDSDHHGNMVNDNVQSVIINPLEPTGAYPVHIVQSQLIGQIDVNSPSASIWIRPLQEDRPQPFRVVGIIMTPPYDEHSDYLESEDQTLPSGWSRGEKVVLPHEILEEATTSQNNIHFTDP